MSLNKDYVEVKALAKALVKKGVVTEAEIKVEFKR